MYKDNWVNFHNQIRRDSVTSHFYIWYFSTVFSSKRMVFYYLWETFLCTLRFFYILLVGWGLFPLNECNSSTSSCDETFCTKISPEIYATGNKKIEKSLESLHPNQNNRLHENHFRIPICAILENFPKKIRDELCG